MARFDRNRHDTFIETRTMLVAQRGYGSKPIECVVHLEFDVGTVIGWMAMRALANKSHMSRYLSNAMRVTVRPTKEGEQ
jgi:hypothetical protein